MAKTIPLTDGIHFAIVSDEDHERLKGFKWEFMPNGSNEYAGRRKQVNGVRTCYLLHREVMGVTDGEIFVDHRSGCGLDCTRENLRVADRCQQMWNTKLSKRNNSGHKGVCWYPQKNRWQTWIMFRGKRKSLGNYKTLEEAVAVRQDAEKRYYGEFARKPEHL